MPAPDADGLLRAHVVDDRRPRVVLRRPHEPLGGVRQPLGRLGDRRHLAPPEEVEGRVVGAEVARLVDRRGERVRARRGGWRRAATRRPAVRCCIAHGHVACELVITCSPRRAVVPRVVQDAVVAGEPAGEDRRVVGERDRREPGHRAPLVRGAHLDQAGDVRRLAGGGHRVEHVGVHAVEQEPDDVPRAARPRRRARRRARRRPARRGGGRASSGAQPRSSAMVGATSTSRPARGHEAVVAHALARRSRTARGPARSRASRARRGGRPGPPSCARRCAARTGRARPGWSNSCAMWSYANGIGVGVARRVRVGELGGEADEAVGRLVGDRILAVPPVRS